MKILYRDNSIIVCIKPAGVISTDEPGGMPERLRKALGDPEAGVRTVHRLDTVVAGLMVYALTGEAASELSRQITEGSFCKEYLAVVEGRPEVEGRLEDLLTRNPAERKTYVASKPGKDTKEAALTYQRCGEQEGLSLVRIQLITGRTHQIRAQFSSRGLPLFGDKKYGAAGQGGIALWSCHLRFVHPDTGETVDFSALPPEIEPWTCFPGFTEPYAAEDVRCEERREAAYGSCPQARLCGGCVYQGMRYDEQLKKKQKLAEKYLAPYGKVLPILGAEDPFHYRNKVFSAFGTDRQGKLISGMYQESSHKIVPVDSCLINSETADRVVRTVRELMQELKLPAYDEKRGSGWLRHVLVRTSSVNGDAMLVLVAASAEFKSKNVFLREIEKRCPEVKTVVLNVNSAFTPVVLGREEKVLCGPGYIEDEICGLRFRISPKSFFQVNHAQTEKLYRTALDFAGLTGGERVIDAYCGTGTIGLCAAPFAQKVLGIELNRDAVHDAIINAKRNGAENIRFICADAGEYMTALARSRDRIDTVFMDPPRSGSTEAFLDALKKLGPKRIVYVSCNPETLARDLKYLQKSPYRVEKIQPVDMFPFTGHVEVVTLLSRA